MALMTRVNQTLFWSQVDKNGPVPAHRPDLGSCWLWRSYIDPDGYGRFSVGSRTDSSKRPALAHRVAYVLTVGEIPEGLEPDHLCRVRHCVNSLHVELVTHAENVRRGAAGAVNRARQLAKTHCPREHPYDTANTQITPEGKRHCRTCRRENSRERRRNVMVQREKV